MSIYLSAGIELENPPPEVIIPFVFEAHTTSVLVCEFIVAPTEVTNGLEAGHTALYPQSFFESELIPGINSEPKKQINSKFAMAK